MKEIIFASPLAILLTLSTAAAQTQAPKGLGTEEFALSQRELVQAIEKPEPAKQRPAGAAKISTEDAKKIALQRVSGKVTDVTIERKKGKSVYVVEIQTGKSEVDVLVDTETGKILGTE